MILLQKPVRLLCVMWLLGALIGCGRSAAQDPAAPAVTTSAPAAQAPQLPPEGAAAQMDHLDITCSIDPQRHWLSAQAVVTWEAGMPASQVSFDLRPSLRIRSFVTEGGQAVEYSRDADGRITANLPQAIPAGRKVTLKLEYEGEINGPRGGASGKRLWDYIGPEGTYVRFEASWYPNDFGDSITAQVRIKVPQGWSAVSSGRLVSKAQDEFRWSVTHPAMGLSFTAAPYVVREETVSGLPVQCYTFARHAGRAEEFIRECGKILQLQQELYGKYPFEKFAIAEIPDLYGGGHGDQSFIMLQERTFEDSFDGEFVTHEMTHNWWGNLIACTESEFLIEAFPTYTQALWRERTQGAEAFRECMKGQAQSVLMASTGSEDETSCYESDSGALLYEKGSWILHMLRHLMGTEKWLAAVRGFAEANVGKNVTCAQFQQAMEQAYGQPLGWFFDQWLYGKGVPWVRAEVTGVVGGVATLKLSQCFVLDIADEAAAGQGGWKTKPSSFRLPVELLLDTTAGPVRWSAWLEKPEAQVQVKVAGQVQKVTVDPGCWVLDHSKGLVGELEEEMRGLEKQLGKELGGLM